MIESDMDAVMKRLLRAPFEEILEQVVEEASRNGLCTVDRIKQIAVERHWDLDEFMVLWMQPFADWHKSI